MRLEQTPRGLNEYIYETSFRIDVWFYDTRWGIFCKGMGDFVGGKEDFARVVREYC